MPAGESISIESLQTEKARREALPLTASAAANIWNFASARTRLAQRAFMSPAEFITLVAGWGAGLALLLFVSALARYLS
jgi:hypothetical protein